ncbi:putative drug exporter of the RND superfamily [Streptosporangium subroseum]|uniref:Putative drug exporter of the RND superfamily n=1 Tax=Streptosporangium subroseum TaxID=106412 RepID=A0A239EHK1_9ACTN|nr:MMPL family transporter [Streptosporangium subroseum]SNS44039.1 putative drug exporter of the RND superfamily [Streptosporangium subroseum]
MALALTVSGLALAFGGASTVSTDPADALPRGSESAAVARLQQDLPSGEVLPALVVYSREGALTGEDRAAIAADAERLAERAVGGKVPPPVVSPGGDVAMLTVPLPGTLPNAELTETVAEIRAEARAGLPSGARVEVTGGAGFKVDLSAVFAGADITLLAVTASVVALLLLLTYRSPWLWLVPLTVVGVADQVAAKTVALLTRVTGLTVDDSTLGITSVLVFGAGTNYALLLIARYREQLRVHDDRHRAMSGAVRSAAPAILASSATVALALCTLLFALSPSSRAIGVAGAIGIVVAVAYALLVLPAAMVLFGRGLFWPFAPKAGQADPTRTGLWWRVGTGVSRRPVAMTLLSLGALTVLALGAWGVQSGLSQTEQFRERVEAIAGQETLSRAFPAGSAQPVTVITRGVALDRVLQAARATPGVTAAAPGERTPELARISVVLKAEPGSEASFAAVEKLREAVHAVPGAQALVGGQEAADLDERRAATRDQLVIIPLVLAVVMLVLLLLLRSVVAALTLVLTVIVSFAAGFGAGWFAFRTFLGFPAMDLGVPLLSFLFLVALGVDYNIFLTHRAREEAARQGTRAGILTALAVTGGVITSAGIVLAAVFAVLGVLPLITLTQLGVIVGFGVLLDTLLVRSVLVPALITLLGERFWWPGGVGTARGSEERKGAPADRRP